MGDYWVQKGKDFAGYYNPNKISFKNFVGFFLESRTRLLKKMLKGSEGGNLLDLGCGSGEHISVLASDFKSIIGIDISDGLLEEAHNKTSMLNNVIIQKSDATKRIPYNDNFFDVIISLGLLDYVPYSVVLDECKRVLRKDGVMIFTIPKKPSLFFFLRGNFGNKIRHLFLGLPPLSSIISKKELMNYVENSGLELLDAKSLWSTMWIVKIKKL